MSNNIIVQLLVIVAMSMWFFGWAGTMFLSSTRVIFAAAFDRLLPEAVASVNEKTRTPVWALALMVIPGTIVSYLYCFDVIGFQSLTLAATLVIGMTFFGTTIAATILPYTKKELYQSSPIAKFNVVGIPLITVCGAIATAFLGYLLYQWMLDPNELYGIGLSNTTSVIFMGALYGTALLIYVGMRLYRKQKEGINLDVLYREIPVE
jgi:amino acid transporter